MVIMMSIIFAPTAQADSLRDKCRDSKYRTEHQSQCSRYYGGPFTPKGGSPGAGGGLLGTVGRILGGLSGGLLGRSNQVIWLEIPSFPQSESVLM